MSNPAKCLSLHNLSNKLPEAVVTAIKRGNRTLLESHIEELQQESKDIKAKYKTAVDAHIAEAIKATTAYAYTNRPTDPTNELNKFKPSGLDKLKANMVQRYGTIKQLLKSVFAENELTKNDIDVLRDFTKKDGFNQQFRQALDKIFKTTEYQQFRYIDPIQYFPQLGSTDTSKLDDLITTAMSATAFEWIHTEGIMATGQTKTTIKQTFGLSKDAAVPKSLFEHLGDVGVNRDYLADLLGRTILERINITPTEQADIGAKARLTKSLGLQAIAVMENMKFSTGKAIVERQEVYVGKVTYDYGVASGYGIAALKAGVEIDNTEDVFYDPSPEQRALDNDTSNKSNTGKKNKPTKAYIKLNTNRVETHELHTDLIKSKALLSNASDVFDKIFGTETVNKPVSFKRIKLAVKAKIAEFGTANEKQTANLQKNIDVVYTKSVPVTETFQAITGAARDIIIGVASMDNKLLIREKSVNGINRSIARDIQMFDDQMLREETNGSDFYLGAKFTANHRMRQTGMSPQNSKIIRNLFNPKSWSVSFDPKTDTKTLDAFKQAIALSFDIETLKVGGKDIQLEKFNKMLDKPVIKEALAVLQDFHSPTNTNKTMSEANQMIVAKAVKELGTKVHGLKGLVEYARFLNHTDGEFTTDIYNEMDGVSNGPIIGMLMLIRDTTDMAEIEALLGSLAMGGISVDSRTGIPNLDKLMNQYNLNDAYQRMGQEWAFIEARMKAKEYSNSLNMNLKDSERREAKEKYNQLMALEFLLGRFTEHEEDGVKINDGIVNKLIRKLSKPRTMQTMYGAMIATQNGILSGENVIDEGIYDGIEKIIADYHADPDNVNHALLQKRLSDILNAARTLSTDDSNLSIENYFTDGKLQIEKLQGVRGKDGKVIHQGFQLSPKQIKAITKATRNTYGEAMKQAIEKVYAPVIAARKPFKTMNQRAASVYNLVLQAKWNAAIAEKNRLLDAEYETQMVLADANKVAISKEATRNKRKLTPEEHKRISAAYPKPLSSAQDRNRLTVEDAKKITDSIKYLLPKIKTPIGSDLYLAKRGDSNNEASINSKDYSEGATVEQNYANDTSKAKEYVDTIPYLANLGVSGGLVRAIQMIDGMIANHMMGVEGVDLLNVHDATLHNIKDIGKVNYEANNIFKEIMFGSDTKPAYSLGQAIVDMHNEMTANDKSLDSVLAENGIKPSDQINLFLADNVINPDTYDITEEQIEKDIAVLQAIAKRKNTYLSYKDAAAQALKNRVGLTDNMTEPEQQAFLEDLHKRIETNAITMAEQVTRNKEEIGKFITYIAQFPYNGEGVSYKSASSDSTVMGVPRDSVLSITGLKADETISKMGILFNLGKDKGSPGFSGSSNTSVSNDSADYTTQSPDTRHINSQNVTNVFESIFNLDNQAGQSSVQNSDEHIADLKRILNNIVAKVMKPVTFYMSQYQGQNDETRGEYDPNNATIWLQRQQVGQPTPGMLGQGIRMSAAVVYAHELIHHITTFGLKHDQRTARMVSDLYETTREALEAKYGNNAFKVFLNETLETDADLSAYLNDSANAHEIIAAKARWEHLFNPKKNANNTNKGLDEFVAFGMTDENFKRELSQLAVDPRIIAKRKSLTTIFEKNLQTTLVNIYNMMMDFIQNMFHGQKHSPTVAQELENLVVTLSKIDTKNKNLIFNAAAEAEAKATAFGLVMDDKFKNIAAKTMNKTKLGAAMNKLKTLPELDNMLSHRMRVAMLWYKDQEQGLLPSIYTEMKGTTERLRGLHTLLSRRNIVIDTAKEEVAATMSSVVRGWFNRKLASPEKTALTKVLLKGDISSLMDISSMDAIKGFIESPTKRKAHITKLTQDLQLLINGVTKNAKQRQQYMTFFAGGVQDIAYGMINSEGFKEGANFRNANNLAIMDNTPYKNKLVSSPAFSEIVSILDQMISVSSIDYMSHKDKAYVAELMNSNPEAIKNVLINHNNLKKQAADQLFNGKPELMEKGYVKTILNPRIQFEQGTLADEQAFLDRGFTRHEYPFKRDGGPNGVDPVTDDIYMYISHNGTINDYLSGIASITRNKKKGVTFYDIEKQKGTATDNLGQAAYNDNQTALANIKAKTMAMLNSSVRTKRNDDSNAMMPAFNTKGEMTTLRYIMSEHTKNTVLQQFSDFDTVLGSMASQIVDKMNTPIINADLVIALRELWDKEKTKYPEAYVKIGPNSTVKRYREIYEQFPTKMKEHILSEWGENGMMVSQDVVNLAFGQRKYSITEMFGKTQVERNTFERLTIEALTFALGFYNPLANKQLDSRQGRAVTRAKNIEDFMIQLTKLAKGNIIVRNIRVTWGNHLSNVMYLKNQGIPLKTIMLLQREAFTSVLQYQADNDKLQELYIKRNVYINDNSMSAANKDIALKNIDRAVMRLEHLLANNPSTEMIKAGLLPSIIEDLDASTTHKPHRFGLDKAIEGGLNKLPEKIANAGRVVFMTEDGEGFKTLNNMVKMTDYVGRYVLYKHYISKGMAKSEAMSRVQDEFINFAPPTHRIIEYANAVGAIWFSKYLLRVQKHIKNNITERPFTTLATFLISSATHGNNILNSVPFITKDMSQLLGDPFAAMTSSINGITTIDAAGSAANTIF